MRTYPKQFHRWTMIALTCALTAGRCFSTGGGTSMDASALLPVLALGPLVSANTTTSTCPANAVALPDSTAIADAVNSAPGAGSGSYSDSSLAVNAVCGGGSSSGSFDVFQLDATESGSVIILEWSGRKVNNGSGIDFVVYENAFNYGDGTRFMEPIVVDVRDDISGNYCGFAANYTNGDETVYSNDPSLWTNFAGITPVLINQRNTLTEAQIFDTSVGGGDGFDLDNLNNTAEFGNGCDATARANILANGFTLVRLQSASSVTNADSGSNFPVDSGAFGGGPDIDGVIARNITAR